MNQDNATENNNGHNNEEPVKETDLMGDSLGDDDVAMETTENDNLHTQMGDIGLSTRVVELEQELGETKEKLLERADQSVYEAKLQGRNKVVSAEVMEIKKKIKH